MKHIFQQFTSRFLFRAAKCLLLVLFAGQISSVFACKVNLTANPAFQKISKTQVIGNIVYSGKLRWEYFFCSNGSRDRFIEAGKLHLFTGNLTPADIKGVSGLQIKALAPKVSGLLNGMTLAQNNPISEGNNWSIDFVYSTGFKNLGVTIEQDIVITASNSVVSGNFPDPNGANLLKAALSADFIESAFTIAWALTTGIFITSGPTPTGTPTLPTISTSTCQLSVPNTLTVPTATLNDFVVPGMRGTKLEAKGTSFNIRINCASTSTSFTPTVTFSYGEGFFCMPGNGAPSVTAAKNIGFAIKTSLNGTSISDYICGKSSTIGGTNVVSFPASTANAIYDQSKTFFVNYAIQGSPPSTGFVQANVTVTADFP